jgi:hypothetical protein
VAAIPPIPCFTGLSLSEVWDTTTSCADLSLGVVVIGVGVDGGGGGGGVTPSGDRAAASARCLCQCLQRPELFLPTKSHLPSLFARVCTRTSLS